MEKAKELRATAIHAGYTKVVKPFFFARDAEWTHDLFLVLTALVGRAAATRWLAKAAFYYEHPMLRQELMDLTFANPVGLAAGFDKNARLTQALPSIGFDFEEVGSVTARAYAGNARPRLTRLPKSKSIVVNYGLMNDGAEVIAGRLAGLKFAFPLGVSIAFTNDPVNLDPQCAAQDYVTAWRELAPLAGYVTLNLSCPNTQGVMPFSEPANVTNLLAAVSEEPIKRPILLKLSPDLTPDQLDGTLAAADKYGVAGLIATNLTKKREGNLAILDDNLPEKGGLSGGVVRAKADQTLEYIARQTKGRFVLVGCGGIFSAEDAYRKIGLGASLLQMITGLIFEGPQLVGVINQGLVELMRRDGFKNINEAVGKDL